MLGRIAVWLIFGAFFSQACTTFNFLNCESRLVAAALLPPKEVQRGENKTYVEAEKRRKAIYGDDETVMKIPPSF